MTDTTEKDLSVYEIGYLIVSSIPDEKVAGEAETVKKIITDAGATIIADEAPRREQLAYTIQKKTVSGGYDRYDVAHFGWVKFELGSESIEAVKNAIEKLPTILRVLLVSTVRENTYLGKRAPAIASVVSASVTDVSMEDKKEVPATPITIEDMDKSIDNMVKEV